jgi:SAM-dependent methyltransferase
MIAADGYRKFCIWEHSQSLRELYARRCRREEEEMTAHRQTVGLLRPYLAPRDVLLDVGCGSGYFFHSLRDLGVEYFGIDAAPSLLAIGRRYLGDYGLAPDRLIDMRIEDLTASVDHIVCINVLSNIDNFHRPLERLLLATGKTLILRESIADSAQYSYVEDRFLDPGVSLKVHVNTYSRTEIADFARSYGFDVTFHVDEHSGGRPQDVIGYPHWWTFARAVRREGTA